jgi:hypothetical protein
MLPSRVFKRIVPPRAGLLRPCAFTFSFPVLDGIFKEGISMGRFLPRVLSEADKGTFLPESDMKSELDQYAYK